MLPLLKKFQENTTRSHFMFKNLAEESQVETQGIIY
jgi:hypothetical protein